MLPIVAGSIAEGIADARDLYGALSEGLAKPHVLDDTTLDRVEAVYSETLEWVEVYERQLQRWQLRRLSISERAEVDRLAELIPGWREQAQKLPSARQRAEGGHDRRDHAHRSRGSSRYRCCSGSDLPHSAEPSRRPQCRPADDGDKYKPLDFARLLSEVQLGRPPVVGDVDGDVIAAYCRHLAASGGRGGGSAAPATVRVIVDGSRLGPGSRA